MGKLVITSRPTHRSVVVMVVKVCPPLCLACVCGVGEGVQRVGGSVCVFVVCYGCVRVSIRLENRKRHWSNG